MFTGLSIQILGRVRDGMFSPCPVQPWSYFKADRVAIGSRAWSYPALVLPDSTVRASIKKVSDPLNVRGLTGSVANPCFQASAGRARLLPSREIPARQEPRPDRSSPKRGLFYQATPDPVSRFTRAPQGRSVKRAAPKSRDLLHFGRNAFHAPPPAGRPVKRAATATARKANADALEKSPALTNRARRRGFC